MHLKVVKNFDLNATLSLELTRVCCATSQKADMTHTCSSAGHELHSFKHNSRTDRLQLAMWQPPWDFL